MRIAFFSEVFLPKIDGIVNTLCYLLDHLEKNGDKCLVVAPKGALSHYHNTKVIASSASALPFYPELKLADPFQNLDAAIDDFRPDLIHIVNPFALGLVGLRYAKSHHIPLVASYHTDIPGFAARWGMGIFRPWLWTYLRWIHNQAYLNLCPSRTTQNDLKQQRFERVQVWTRGVDIHKFHPHYANPTMRDRLTSGQSCSRLLLYVGRFSAEKRIDWLKDILLAAPGTHLALVGDGPQREQLKQTFQGFPVTFTGYLRGTDLSAAYASADIFVFPAANETFGNVALEAMASGIPVVAPKAGGLLDFIEHQQNGLLFEQENRSSLVEQTLRLIQDPELAGRIGQAGRQTADRRGWDTILEELIAQYQGVIQNQPAFLYPKKPLSLRRMIGLNDFQ